MSETAPPIQPPDIIAKADLAAMPIAPEAAQKPIQNASPDQPPIETSPPTNATTNPQDAKRSDVTDNPQAQTTAVIQPKTRVEFDTDEERAAIDAKLNTAWGEGPGSAIDLLIKTPDTYWDNNVNISDAQRQAIKAAAAEYKLLNEAIQRENQLKAEGSLVGINGRLVIYDQPSNTYTVYDNTGQPVRSFNQKDHVRNVIKAQKVFEADQSDPDRGKRAGENAALLNKYLTADGRIVSQTETQLEYEKQAESTVNVSLDFIAAHLIKPIIVKDKDGSERTIEPFKKEGDKIVGDNEEFQKELLNNPEVSPETARVAGLIILAGHYFKLQETPGVEAEGQRIKMAAIIQHELQNISPDKIPDNLKESFVGLKNNKLLTAKYGEFMTNLKTAFFGKDVAVPDEHIMEIMLAVSQAEAKGIKLDPRNPNELPPEVQRALANFKPLANEIDLATSLLREGSIGNFLSRELGLSSTRLAKENLGKYVEIVANKIIERKGENEPEGFAAALRKLLSALMDKENLLLLLHKLNIPSWLGPALLMGAVLTPMASQIMGTTGDDERQ